MPKLKIVSGEKLVRFLEKQGFLQTRQVGSHIVLTKGSRTIVIPLRKGKDLGRGIISSMLHDANISKEKYQKHI